MPKFRYRLIVLFAGLSLFALFNLAGMDFVLANLLYNWQGGEWRLQHHWLTEQVFHQGVRSLNQLLMLILIAYYFWQRVYRKQQTVSVQALGLLLLSLVLSFACIALTKRLVPTECPWDLQAFGGSFPYIGLFMSRPDGMPNTQCFPAGHASIGFAWIAIYFYYLRVKPTMAKLALIAALSVGFTLGFAQQLRGAHFFSHDLATAMLCWLIAGTVFSLQAFATRIKTIWIKPALQVENEQRSPLL